MRRATVYDLEISGQAARLLSVPEVAGVLGIRPQTIYNKLCLGLFPIRHKKIGRLVRFDSREVAKYLDSLPDRR